MKCINLKVTIAIILLTSNFIFGQNKTPIKDQIEQTIESAQNLVKTGDVAGAINLIQTELKKNPQNANLIFWLGKVFYSQGNYQKTIETLTPIHPKLVQNSNEHKQTIQMLGLSHYISGQLVNAIPYFEKILEWTPKNSEVGYALGVSYIQTRQPEKSRIVFARLFGVPINSPASYLLNAQMLIRQQFEETAEIELNKAIQLDAKLPQVRFLLGELAIYKSEIDKGIALLKEELAINPANSMAYYRLGEALSRQLKWDEAIQPLQKSIWLNPFFSGPYIVLGKVYFKKQDVVNAENLLRRATSVDPNNFGAHHLLGQVLQQAGRTNEAKAEFELAEKLRGKNEQNPN
jgi:tetratricopeptide (TPR) repeat protein